MRRERGREIAEKGKTRMPVSLIQTRWPIGVDSLLVLGNVVVRGAPPADSRILGG